MLALASITLASLQSDDGIFESVGLSTFLANVFHFMCDRPLDGNNISKTANHIRTLLQCTSFSGIKVPTCPSEGSCFSSAWGSGRLLASESGKISRPHDSEGRDGSVECNGKTVLHVECKNLKGGLTTEVFKKVIGKMGSDCKVSLLFASNMNVLFSNYNAYHYAEQGLGLNLSKVCFLVVKPDADPYWLHIEEGNLTLKPGESTEYLMVLIATGAVASKRSAR